MPWKERAPARTFIAQVPEVPQEWNSSCPASCILPHQQEKIPKSEFSTYSVYWTQAFKMDLADSGGKKKKSNKQKAKLKTYKSTPCLLEGRGGGGRGMSISTDMKFEDREVLSLKITWFLAKTLSRCMPPFFERLLELGLDFRDKWLSWDPIVGSYFKNFFVIVS